MVVGQTQTFWIPSNLGPKVKGAAAPDLTLIVELLEILTPPKAPPDLRAPSRGAIVERDGLASKVLTKGTGTVHPTKSSTVTVAYAGWTSDGKLINSSYTRGEPAMVTVGSDLPGFTEALQLMVEGEKRRVWIPKRLAYQSKSDAPRGMLVFDIQLQKIHPGASL
jgi:FKBP-type peptidyl-prolyl cis-trans isomerase